LRRIYSAVKTPFAREWTESGEVGNRQLAAIAWRSSLGTMTVRRRCRGWRSQRVKVGSQGRWATKGRIKARQVWFIHQSLYSHCMLTIASRLDVMNRLGRAMADPTRSRILLTLLDAPSYPAVLARELELSRSNVSNHLTCLRDCGIVVAEPEGRQTRYEIADPHLARALIALVDVTLAIDGHAPCLDPSCDATGSCGTAG